MAQMAPMKRGRIQNICGPQNNRSHLFIIPDSNYDDAQKIRNVFALKSTMVNFKDAKPNDVVYYYDEETKKKKLQRTYTQATKVITDFEYDKQDHHTVYATIDNTAQVLTPVSDNEEVDQSWGYWKGNQQHYGKAYEREADNVKGSGSSMSSGQQLSAIIPPWKKPRLHEDEHNEDSSQCVGLCQSFNEKKEEPEDPDHLKSEDEAKFTCLWMAPYDPQCLRVKHA